MTVADLLRELIRIPSVNPDGDPVGAPTQQRLGHEATILYSHRAQNSPVRPQFKG